MTMPAVSVAQVAAWVRGRIVGPDCPPLTGVAPLEEAARDQLSFLADRRYLPAYRVSQAGAVLVSADWAAEVEGPPTRIVVEYPKRALAEVIRHWWPAPPPVPAVHPTAVVGRGCEWPPDVRIDPYVVLGDGVRLGHRVHVGAGCVLGAASTLGDDCVLDASVTLYPRTRLGHRVVLHAGTVVGCDGFGFVEHAEMPTKVTHVGGVIIEDDVEIGANCTIDRGWIGDTVIGAHTKIDNLVHVGHNTRVGRRCLIAGAAAIAGSAVLEDGVVLAGQAGVSDHVRIGAGAQVGAQAGVMKDVPAGARYAGMPARPLRDQLRAAAATYRMSKLLPRVEEFVRTL